MQSARITSEAEIGQVLDNRDYQVALCRNGWYESVGWKSRRDVPTPLQWAEKLVQEIDES
jgi:hypothetical protein